ncbi:signal recognition particle protein [Entomospira culicis]|uniref:Signal recognition particle protein n=1 Tax=Entomospira culicis TaxID=2719989 RepID=A0A968KU72_9SPIO|nr:signal recognition particle protein [Entomospira culicis]NIZ19014.1 signal recognition particle protein [Entomospira culicis]NIZ69229.1 signal recognition particle protein [Entomospira culicis]WDI37813.1 signal recognition particle protein [Entomospira culicis]WDI39441.1 signal recognition particle protein [Entomospira culicis]
MLERLQDSFAKITKTLVGKSKITDKNIEDAIEEIKTALLEADVNLRVARRFINATAEEARGEKVLKAVDPGQQFVKIIYDKMVALLGDERSNLNLRGPDVVSTILFLGLQGAGKTTNAAKLALHLKNEGRRVLLCAADLSRPAAVKQLEILGEQIGVPVFTGSEQDPVARSKAALEEAKKHQYNVLIVDTAGRMQVDVELMNEISAISKALNPDEKILVADAMIGQNAVDVAKAFDEQLGVTGFILSKFDSDTRGGAALSLKSITGKPIKFIGVGEKVEALEIFHPERIASRILGMGDIVSLVEKAQEKFDEEEALRMQQKLFSPDFSLEDYLEQIKMVKKMGKAGELAKLLPGVSAKDIEEKLDEQQMVREEAIILSMTKKERKNLLIFNPSRRKRVAKGAGVTVVEVNRFINRFEKMKVQMKKVMKNKAYQAQLAKSLKG